MFRIRADRRPPIAFASLASAWAVLGVSVGLALGACNFAPSGGKAKGGGWPTAEKKNKAPAKPTVAVPKSKPPGWDPLTFNKLRGNSGAIPRAYRGEINGPTGAAKHLGQHLPYQPVLSTESVPEGHIALMWGDPDKGHTRHSHSSKGKGHWFDWIRIRAADDGDVPEQETRFDDWPGKGGEASPSFVVYGGGAIKSDRGRNTIYLAKLPAGVKSGDTVRVWAHCRRHGEYVDFVTLP